MSNTVSEGISYIISEKYFVIRIKKRNVLKTKSRGFAEELNSILSELDEKYRPLGAVLVGLSLYRCKDAEKYIHTVKKAFFDPNLSRLLFEVARYYVNIHSVVRNLNSRLATLTRYVLSTLVNSKST